ncbi:hypothetical protein IPJ70_00835 [Candidatus Campbellbacteria bacterium]|nr:MAG: hypothetical protein IPJ70_00835 [Candidatus Campbellbacteria bacterium]
MDKDLRQIVFDLKDFEPFQGGKRTKINEDVRKKKLENDALEQDIALKRLTLSVLFGFLALETAAVFIFSYFQAVFFKGFALEEWSFKLLVAATLSQITYMIQVAVKHLFPSK